MADLNDEQRQQVRKVRRWILAIMAIALGGIVAWSFLFNPASQDDASDAYYACVDGMMQELGPKVGFSDPGNQTYSGSDGSWVITGTFDDIFGDPMPYRCTAERVSEGVYRIDWE
jgi:hypothetical protein